MPSTSADAPHLLVVDDDPAVIYAARALLARRGAHVEAAFKGLDALARVRAGGVDAVLLDLEMPEVDGLSVLRELRALQPSPRVLLIADAPTAAAREAVARGEALAVLRKPVDFAHALALITGKKPEQPIDLKLEGSRALLPLLRDALEGRNLSLANEAALPAGTPVTVHVPHGRKTIALTGTAHPAKVPHLVVKLAPPSASVRGELTDLLRRGASAMSARPISRKVAKAQSPGRASELFQRGMRRLDQGQYAQALADLGGAAELSHKPEYAAAQMRAQQLVAATRARALIRKARALAPTDPSEALANFEEAIRLEPGRASTHLEAAHLWLQLGENLQAAEERLGAAVHLAPSDPVPRLHLAQVLERTGRAQEALWAADAALALFPGDRALQQTQARLRRKLSVVFSASRAG